MTAHASAPPAAAGEPYDFRGTAKFGRDQIRALQVAHEVFSRRVASALSTHLRAFVQLEATDVHQIPFDDYVRSSATPTVLGVIDCHPLPAPALVDVDAGTALSVVDRMLGGSGRTGAARRPTDLETALLRTVLADVADGIRRTLAPFVAVDPTLQAVEHNPQLVQVAAPTDLTVVLSFHVSIAQPAATEGMVTLCYPVAALEPLVDQLDHDHGTPPADVPHRPLAPLLRTTPVEMAVSLGDVDLAARDIARLAPGDVIRLDVDPDEPAAAHVEGRPVARGHPGRRGRRLALLVTEAVVELAARRPAPEGAPTSEASPTAAPAPDPEPDPDPAGADDEPTPAQRRRR